MADVRQEVMTGIPSPVVSTYTSGNLINDGRSLWKLKLVISGSVTGTTPTLTPQLAGANPDGATFFVAHHPHNPATATGTFWFIFHLDGSDSPVSDRILQLKLVTGGTSPSFGTVVATLYGIK